MRRRRGRRHGGGEKGYMNVRGENFKKYSTRKLGFSFKTGGRFLELCLIIDWSRVLAMGHGGWPPTSSGYG